MSVTSDPAQLSDPGPRPRAFRRPPRLRPRPGLYGEKNCAISNIARSALSGRVRGVTTSPVPGHRERKKQRTREALSWAALRLAVERGLGNVLVEDIASAANVS